MEIKRLEAILKDWSIWMRGNESHKLWYPTRSTFLSSGGESSHDVFEHMLEESDDKNVKIVDACIDSLVPIQKEAVYNQWLGGKPTQFHDRDYALALDNLLTMVSRRIYA